MFFYWKPWFLWERIQFEELIFQMGGWFNHQLRTYIQESYNTPLEHTPGNPPTQLWKDSLYNLLVKVSGCVPKVCWNNLRIYRTQVPNLHQLFCCFVLSRWRRWTMHWPRQIGKRQFLSAKNANNKKLNHESVKVRESAEHDPTISWKIYPAYLVKLFFGRSFFQGNPVYLISSIRRLRRLHSGIGGPGIFQKFKPGPVEVWIFW